MTQEQRYRWAHWGDLNAFFGLTLDSVTNLVVLTGILVGVFRYPVEKVYTLMIPERLLAFSSAMQSIPGLHSGWRNKPEGRMSPQCRWGWTRHPL